VDGSGFEARESTEGFLATIFSTFDEIYRSLMDHLEPYTLLLGGPKKILLEPRNLLRMKERV